MGQHSVTGNQWVEIEIEASPLIQVFSSHSGFSDDLRTKGILTVSLDLPDEFSVILQAHESLYLSDNRCTIMSATQMREHGVEVNDKAKLHNGI